MTLKIAFCTITYLLFVTTISFSQSIMRPLTELTADKSGQEAFTQMVKTAKNNVIVLPVDQPAANEALVQTQVTTRSLMGAIIYFSGGVLIDHGWIRLLGSGSSRLPRSLPSWNKGKTFKEFGEKPDFLLIGDDVIGGFFAINGGALGKDIGRVYYLSPNNLNWESLDRGYSDFVDFCMNGNLDMFYKKLRWKDWQKDNDKLTCNQAFIFYPYLWSAEGKDISKTKRSIVPIQELYDFTISTIEQLKRPQ